MSALTNPLSAAANDPQSYTQAVLALLGTQDPMVVLRATPERLRRAVAGRTPDELRRPERPGKWSAVEVVQHLADSDLVWAYRIRLILADDRPTITGYDQDRWAAALAYRAADMSHALEQFEALRRANLRLLAGLPPAALARVGMHSERGEERLDHITKLYAGHDLAHLRQLARIFEAVGTDRRAALGAG
jgi:hypothetical protein